MQIFYVRAEDLHATKDTIDALESEILEVYVIYRDTPAVRPGGYAGEEQE